MKKQFLIVFFGSLLGFSITYFVMIGNSDNSELPTLIEYFLSALLGVFISYFVYYSSLVLDTFFSFQDNAGLRLFLGIISQFTIGYFMVYFMVYLYSLATKDVLNFSASYHDIFIKTGILLFISILLFQVIYFAFYSYNSYTTFQIASVKQQRKQVELQLKALKSQLSPHFLFNSFNTVSSLLYKDVSKAGVFIRKLATLYQYTLDSYDVKLVTLAEELAFVNSYLFLIKTRFKDSLGCNLEISDSIYNTKIPPLALQMLIENAVKHNEFTKENPLQIHIYKEGDFISISNNVTYASSNVSSFKIGLKNINSRYLLLTGKGIQVCNGPKFEVKIPIIT